MEWRGKRPNRTKIMKHVPNWAGPGWDGALLGRPHTSYFPKALRGQYPDDGKLGLESLASHETDDQNGSHVRFLLKSSLYR